MKLATVSGACLSNSSQVNLPLLVSMTACKGALAGPGSPLVASAKVNEPWFGSPSSACAGVAVAATTAAHETTADENENKR